MVAKHQARVPPCLRILSLGFSLRALMEVMYRNVGWRRRLVRRWYCSRGRHAISNNKTTVLQGCRGGNSTPSQACGGNEQYLALGGGGKPVNQRHVADPQACGRKTLPTGLWDFCALLQACRADIDVVYTVLNYRHVDKVVLPLCYDETCLTRANAILQACRTQYMSIVCDCNCL